jgi:hypothetical protein
MRRREEEKPRRARRASITAVFVRAGLLIDIRCISTESRINLKEKVEEQDRT